MPFASRSQVVQRVEVDRAWPPAVRARLARLVEVMRGSLRATERPDGREALRWPAAGARLVRPVRLLRGSERGAPRRVRGSLRAIERRELLEPLPRLRGRAECDDGEDQGHEESAHTQGISAGWGTALEGGFADNADRAIPSQRTPN